MVLDESVHEVAKGRKKLQKDTDNYFEITVPEQAPISIAMTIWNVMTVEYDVFMRMKAKGDRKTIDFRFPMVVASEAIQVRSSH